MIDKEFLLLGKCVYSENHTSQFHPGASVRCITCKRYRLCSVCDCPDNFCNKKVLIKVLSD